VPIYEYQACNPQKSCNKCRDGFETIQGLKEEPLALCPLCHHPITKLISKCHAAIYENSDEKIHIERKINDYEKANKWSHAAELADKVALQAKDPKMKERALENYNKAGYDPAVLNRYSEDKNT
jgi:predicted nucleic acid-binding Zn ribbon protein